MGFIEEIFVWTSAFEFGDLESQGIFEFHEEFGFGFAVERFDLFCEMLF